MCIVCVPQDPMAQGLLETYRRKCEQIDNRFGDMSAKEIVKSLLGRGAQAMEMDSDDEDEEGYSSDSVGVTGEQGGRLLTCFLVRAEKVGDVSFLKDGVATFLEKQKPKVALYPAAKLCIEKAIKFLPKLERGLAAAQEKARPQAPPSGPSLDFGSDED